MFLIRDRQSAFLFFFLIHKLYYLLSTLFTNYTIYCLHCSTLNKKLPLLCLYGSSLTYYVCLFDENTKRTVLLISSSFFVCFCFAKHMIVGRLFRNIHPSLQYSSHSRIHTFLYDFFLTCTSRTMPLPLGYSVHNFHF